MILFVAFRTHKKAGACSEYKAPIFSMNENIVECMHACKFYTIPNGVNCSIGTTTFFATWSHLSVLSPYINCVVSCCIDISVSNNCDYERMIYIYYQTSYFTPVRLFICINSIPYLNPSNIYLKDKKYQVILAYYLMWWSVLIDVSHAIKTVYIAIAINGYEVRTRWTSIMDQHSMKLLCSLHQCQNYVLCTSSSTMSWISSS